MSAGWSVSIGCGWEQTVGCRWSLSNRWMECRFRFFLRTVGDVLEKEKAMIDLPDDEHCSQAHSVSESPVTEQVGRMASCRHKWSCQEYTRWSCARAASSSLEWMSLSLNIFHCARLKVCWRRRRQSLLRRTYRFVFALFRRDLCASIIVLVVFLTRKINVRLVSNLLRWTANCLWKVVYCLTAREISSHGKVFSFVLEAKKKKKKKKKRWCQLTGTNKQRKSPFVWKASTSSSGALICHGHPVSCLVIFQGVVTRQRFRKRKFVVRRVKRTRRVALLLNLRWGESISFQLVKLVRRRCSSFDQVKQNWQNFFVERRRFSFSHSIRRWKSDRWRSISEWR